MLGVGAEILRRRAPFIIFVPRYAPDRLWLAEVLGRPMHGSAQEVVTTIRYISSEVLALQAVLNCESVGGFFLTL